MNGARQPVTIINYKLLIINYKFPMRSYSKKELACLAGVSCRTFSRWITLHRTELSAMGVSPTAHILPPKAVKYLCDIYSIDVE